MPDAYEIQRAYDELSEIQREAEEAGQVDMTIDAVLALSLLEALEMLGAHA